MCVCARRSCVSARVCVGVCGCVLGVLLFCLVVLLLFVCVLCGVDVDGVHEVRVPIRV